MEIEALRFILLLPPSEFYRRLASHRSKFIMSKPMKRTIPAFLLALLALPSCQTAHNAAVSTFRVIDAPNAYVRRKLGVDQEQPSPTPAAETVTGYSASAPIPRAALSGPAASAAGSTAGPGRRRGPRAGTAGRRASRRASGVEHAPHGAETFRHSPGSLDSNRRSSLRQTGPGETGVCLQSLRQERGLRRRDRIRAGAEGERSLQRKDLPRSVK